MLDCGVLRSGQGQFIGFELLALEAVNVQGSLHARDGDGSGGGIITSSWGQHICRLLQWTGHRGESAGYPMRAQLRQILDWIAGSKSVLE